MAPNSTLSRFERLVEPLDGEERPFNGLDNGMGDSGSLKVDSLFLKTVEQGALREIANIVEARTTQRRSGLYLRKYYNL